LAEIKKRDKDWSKSRRGKEVLTIMGKSWGTTLHGQSSPDSPRYPIRERAEENKKLFN